MYATNEIELKTIIIFPNPTPAVWAYKFDLETFPSFIEIIAINTKLTLNPVVFSCRLSLRFFVVCFVDLYLVVSMAL